MEELQWAEGRERPRRRRGDEERVGTTSERTRERIREYHR